MTITERNDKLKAFMTCLKCELSGKCCDDECSTQYDAGNMGEIVENLETISKILDQELEIIECWKDGAFMDSINAFRAIREVLGDTKYYKKLYEKTQYNVCPVRIVDYGSPTVKLKIKMSVPRSIFPATMTCEELAEEKKIRQELVCRLADELEKYITVNVEPSIDRNYIDAVGSLEVIKYDN